MFRPGHFGRKANNDQIPHAETFSSDRVTSLTKPKNINSCNCLGCKAQCKDINWEYGQARTALLSEGRVQTTEVIALSVVQTSETTDNAIANQHCPQTCFHLEDVRQLGWD